MKHINYIKLRGLKDFVRTKGPDSVTIGYCNPNYRPFLRIRALDSNKAIFIHTRPTLSPTHIWTYFTQKRGRRLKLNDD